MKTFKTKAGTELPFANIKGKDYILVPHRVMWLREEHPDWSIETFRVEATDQYVLFKSEIRNEAGRLIATAHKREDYAHFPDALEKAETSSIGRALALCGYGTQFAQELEEQDRIVDSPLIAPKRDNPPKGAQETPLPQVSEVVRPAQGPVGIKIQWNPDEMRQYMSAKWNVDTSDKLTPEQRKEVISLSKSKPFRVAMNDLAVK